MKPKKLKNFYGVGKKRRFFQTKGQATLLIELIIGLVVIATIVGIFFVPKLLESPVQEDLLGLAGLNISDEKVVFYEGLKGDDLTAVSSVNALKYSINWLGLYYYDNEITNQNQFKEIFESKEFKNEHGLWYKEFQGHEQKITVAELLEGHNVIQLKEADKPQVAEQIAHLILQCHNLMKKKAGDANCFSLNLEKIKPGITPVTEKDIEKALEDMLNLTNCAANCQANIKEILGNGLFNAKNWEWDEGLEISRNTIHTLEDGQKKKYVKEDFPVVRICGDDDAINQVHITTKTPGQGYCEDQDEGMKSLKITNFHFPQVVPRPEGKLANIAQAWLGSFGDPKYITYYEVFPKEEYSYWQPSAYKMAIGGLVMWELAFSALNIIPGGQILKGVLGKTLKPLFSTLYDIASKQTTKGLSKLKKSAGDIIETVINSLRKGASEKTLKPLAEEAAETLQSKMAMEWVEKESKSLIQSALKTEGIPDDVIESISEQYFKSLKQATEELGPDAIKLGKLTPQAEKVIRDEMYYFLNRPEIKKDLAWTLGEDGFGKASDKIVTQTLKQVADSTRGKASTTLVAIYRGTLKTKDGLLTPMLSGKYSRTQLQEIVNGLLGRGSSMITHMNSREVRQLMKNRKEVIEALWSKKTKDVVWDFGGQKINANTQNQLAKQLDDMIYNSGHYSKFSELASRVWHTDAFHRRAKVLMAATFASALADSIEMKYYPVGVNSIAYKKALDRPVVFSETKTFTSVNKDDENSLYNFFLKYGDTTTTPFIDEMLPEEYISPFYVQLIPDPGIVSSATPQRFFLASPCRSDIVVDVSRCECEGSTNLPDKPPNQESSVIDSIFGSRSIYESGSYNKELDKTVDFNPHSTQDNMLYSVRSSWEGDLKIVKECDATSTLKWDNNYKPWCINVNPILEDDKDNYCYHGINKGMWTANVLLNYVIPIAGGIGAGAACTAIVPMAPLTPFCYFLGSATTGIVPAIWYASLNTDHAWPAHS